MGTPRAVRICLAILCLASIAACSGERYLENATGSRRVAYDCASGTLTPLDTAVVREHARRIIRRLQLEGRQDEIRPFVDAELAGGSIALSEPVLEYVCRAGVVSADALEPRWPEPGSLVKDFTLARIDPGAPFAVRDSVSNSELASTVYVLDFFGTWCIPCRDLHVELLPLSDAYQPQGVKFYTVLFLDSPKRATDFFSDNGGLVGDLLLEEGSGVAREWGITGLPRTFIVGADGRLARSHIGAPTVSELPGLLDSLLIEATNVHITSR